MRLDRTRIMIILLVTACAVASIFITKIYTIQYAKCTYTIIPGPNITMIGEGQYLLNISRSMFNETIRIFTLKTFGPCKFVVLPYVKIVDLHYRTFKIFFRIGNETVEASSIVIGNEINVTPVKIGPNVTLSMYVQTDAVYGHAIIFTEVRIVK